ncbi:MAG: Trm112 family protein [Candidatus Dormibacteraeota bacterium]|nr:Trm112 family protein [Candidatus Dormibacteraeota bacterium]
MPAQVDPQLLEILACPKCHTHVELEEDGAHLRCDTCHLRYRIDDGIPVMLISEAETF